jgi:hypothetical protein
LRQLPTTKSAHGSFRTDGSPTSRPLRAWKNPDERSLDPVVRGSAKLRFASKIQVQRSLARKATGFTLFEFGMSRKWLELLKQIAPGLKRAAVLRDGAGR